MAYIDYNYNETHGEKIGWLGLFEAIENSDAAEMLLDTGNNYLKKNGCTKITGPAKYNANGEIGLLVDGFDKKPYFMEPYNTPVSYTHLRAHETDSYLVCRLLL